MKNQTQVIRETFEISNDDILNNTVGTDSNKIHDPEYMRLADVKPIVPAMQTLFIAKRKADTLIELNNTEHFRLRHIEAVYDKFLLPGERNVSTTEFLEDGRFPEVWVGIQTPSGEDAFMGYAVFRYSRSNEDPEPLTMETGAFFRKYDLENLVSFSESLGNRLEILGSAIARSSEFLWKYIEQDVCNNEMRAPVDKIEAGKKYAGELKELVANGYLPYYKSHSIDVINADLLNPFSELVLYLNIAKERENNYSIEIYALVDDNPSEMVYRLTTPVGILPEKAIRRLLKPRIKKVAVKSIVDLLKARSKQMI